MRKPLAIDLYCGLGGWAEGFLSESYDVIGFDIERHRYPKSSMSSDGRKVAAEGVDFNAKGVPSEKRSFNYANQVAYRNSVIEGEWDEYPGQLVLQDVMTLHGSQFRNADVIVASPPCQAYSYRAMPWKRAKALPPPDNSLFEACFRIQREASEAAGRYIPLVVENVRGAQKWVGRASWNFGSYYLWGDLPALMPYRIGMKNGLGGSWFRERNGKPTEGNDPSDLYLTSAADKPYVQAMEGQKVGVYSDPRRNGGRGVHLTNPRENSDGLKFGGGCWHDATNNLIRKASSRSLARKAASAQIAKIPFPLAQWIAQVYKP